MRTTRPTRAYTAAAGALWLAVTLYETLTPTGWLLTVPFWSFFTVVMANADLVQNIVLFLPMGWIANRGGWPARRAVLAGALISGSIEFTQQWVAGRTTTASDILCNTLGAALGWWMATQVTRPRLRAGLSCGALAMLLGLHELNTAWLGNVAAAGGDGAWREAETHPCDASVPETAICMTVPNSAAVGNTLIRVVGQQEHTFANVRSTAYGRPMAGGDCVTLRFEWTVGARLRFRPPLTHACGLAGEKDSTFELRIDPRLEHAGRGGWEPTRAGVWMWPIWPWEAYHPGLLRAVGALTFVIGTAMLAGAAFWWLPVSYLLMLQVAAFAYGMGGPGWWELCWVAVGWVVAFGVVRVDEWWRAQSERTT